MFATLAQMMILAVSDLDLSIGPFVSLVASIGATLLPTQPALALLALAAAVGAYALAGAVIELRRLPSIVVTLGLSLRLARLCRAPATNTGRAGTGLAEQRDGLPHAMAADADLDGAGRRRAGTP